MGAGSITMDARWDEPGPLGLSPRTRHVDLQSSAHHPTGSPHRKSRIAGAEVRLREIDFSIAQTVTMTETVLGATTFTT